MNLGEIWTFILELIAQIIIPAWNNLIQYLPLLIVLLVLVSIAGLAWAWQRNAAANRPRVPKPVPPGRKPADMHLPGPSLWPFVAPAGLLLIVFAVVFGVFESLANLFLLGLGFLFLLANFDVIDYGSIWKFWPVLIIVIGVKLVFEHAAAGRAKNRD